MVLQGIMTCQEWYVKLHVKTYMSRITYKEWQVKSYNLILTYEKEHFNMYMWIIKSYDYLWSVMASYD